MIPAMHLTAEILKSASFVRDTNAPPKGMKKAGHWAGRHTVPLIPTEIPKTVGKIMDQGRRLA